MIRKTAVVAVLPVLFMLIYVAQFMVPQSSASDVRLLEVAANDVEKLPCASGELRIQFIQLQTFAPVDHHTADIIGTLDMPNPTYIYSLEFPPTDSEFTSGNMLRGTLRLYERDPDMMSIQVITPMKIEQRVEIPHSATGVFIDVIKTFGGQPEYFMVRFVEGFNGEGHLCMPPEMYK
ncbi:MAG: hypothetical protein COA45_03040 [Zetaproteobacteria bacterium]|nr:MAG: hypothetical protein COA45_03040 [Zetaproteobacteria bacterium]